MDTNGAGDDRDWYRYRGYPHFDHEVSRGVAAEIAAKPDRVAAHGFHPFLQFTKIVPRYRSAEHAVVPKQRDLACAAHTDAHVYSRYAHALGDPYESALSASGASDSVIAYRPLGKSNIEFARDAFAAIDRIGPCVALAYDIKGYFDTIDHGRLKTEWCELLRLGRLPPDHFAVFRSITKYAYVRRDDLPRLLGRPLPRRRRERLGGPPPVCTPIEFRERVRDAGGVHVNPNPFGIPQGSPISAFLSNIYLLPFDRVMVALARAVGGRYWRYCDDILFVCPPAERARVDRAIRDGLTERALTINEDKFEQSTFTLMAEGQLRVDRPLQYLGFAFDGNAVRVRSSSLARFHARMKRAVRRSCEHARRSGCNRVYRRKLYERFSHLGGRNAVRYVLRAAEIMRQPAIRRQVSRHWPLLHLEIAKREAEA